MTRVLLIAAVLTSGVGFAASRPQATEKLYLAVEVRQEGKLVATPKLLGEIGKAVRAERRQPGAMNPDYRLALMPTQLGSRIQIDFDLQLPRAEGHGNLFLQHGEERKLELGTKPGDLVVSLMVMKVNSPEFRALMSRVAVGERAAKATSI